MDAAALVPTPDTLQVHWFWFQLLLTITFFLHIVVMNIMLGSSIIAMVNQVRNKGDLGLCKDISKKLPYTIAFAVNFGVAPLLFVQVLYGHFIYTSSVLMAVYWLSIIALLIIAYYLAYIYNMNFERLGANRTAVITFVALILSTIGFFFVNNMTMLQNPESWTRYFDSRGGMLLHLNDPTVIPRYLHFVLSAIAVSGMALALLNTYRQSKGVAGAEEGIKQGTAWYGYATMANFGVGFWFFGMLPKDTYSLSTLPGALFAIFLLVGIVAAVYSVIMAMSQRVLPALYSLIGTLFAMIIARDFSRAGYLRDYFSPGDLTVVPQYSPLLCFLLLFVAGLVLIGWMLNTAMKVNSNEEVQS